MKEQQNLAQSSLILPKNFKIQPQKTKELKANLEIEDIFDHLLVKLAPRLRKASEIDAVLKWFQLYHPNKFSKILSSVLPLPVTVLKEVDYLKRNAIFDDLKKETSVSFYENRQSLTVKHRYVKKWPTLDEGFATTIDHIAYLKALMIIAGQEIKNNAISDSNLRELVEDGGKYLKLTQSDKQMFNQTAVVMYFVIQMLPLKFQKLFVLKNQELLVQYIDIAIRFVDDFIDNKFSKEARSFVEQINSCHLSSKDSEVIKKLGKINNFYAEYCESIGDFTQAGRYYLNSYECLKTHPSTKDMAFQALKKFINNNSKKNDFTQVYEMLGALPESADKTLLIQYCYHLDNDSRLAPQLIANLPKAELSTCLVNTLLLMNLKFSCSKNNSNQVFKNSLNRLKQAEFPLENIIAFCVELNHLEDAEKIIKDIPIGVIKNNFVLAQCYIIFGKGYKKIEKEINSYKFAPEQKSELLYLAAIKWSNNNHPQQAMECIKKALKGSPANPQYLQLKEALTTVITTEVGEKKKDASAKDKEVKTVEQISESPEKSNNLEEKKEIVSQEGSSNNIDFANMTARQIHSYFQALKQQKLKEVCSSPSASSKAVWQYEKYHIKEDETSYAMDSNGVKYHVYIPNKIRDKVIYEEKFQKVLEKNIISSTHKNNSIVFVGKKAFEITITEDERVYGNKIVVNLTGNACIIFDHYGNHDKATKFFNSHQIEKIYTFDENVSGITGNNYVPEDYQG